MSSLLLQKKNRVQLDDFEYLEEVRTRKFFFNISQDWIVLLEELLFFPSKISLYKAALALSLSKEEFLDVLSYFAPLNFFEIDQDYITFDKDLRKGIEFYLGKFEANFIGGIDYFQSLLKRVPIHLLPTWYSLPRSCDSIFSSLIERIFHTPQHFQRHLLEIEQEDELYALVLRNLYKSKNFSVDSETLRQQLEIDPDNWQALLLHLELSLVLVVGYRLEKDRYRETLYVPTEFREYLSKRLEKMPRPILDQRIVIKERGVSISFPFDLSQVLAATKRFSIKISYANDFWTIDAETIKDLSDDISYPIDYLNRLISKLIYLGLAIPSEGLLLPAIEAQEWLASSLERQALALFKALWMKDPNSLRYYEKGLSRISDLGWVLMDECIQTISSDRFYIEKTGKRWYYTAEDKRLLTPQHFETLFECGLIEFGSYEGNRCLKLTEFGKQITQ